MRTAEQKLRRLHQLGNVRLRRHRNGYRIVFWRPHRVTLRQLMNGDYERPISTSAWGVTANSAIDQMTRLLAVLWHLT